MIDVLVIGGVFREVLRGDAVPRLRYGGSGLTASIAAARLGAEVVLASYVGDEDEETVRTELELAGVDHTFLEVLPGACGTFLFPAQQSPERPWPMYRPAEAIPRSRPTDLPSSKVILAFGIPDFDPVAEGWLDSITPEAILLWDRQGWLSRVRDSSKLIALPPRLKVYLANEKEAIQDSHQPSYDAMLAIQPPVGFTTSIIKRGSRGVVVVDDAIPSPRLTIVDAFAVEAESTIGTGDVFAGALSAKIAAGVGAQQAAIWGCAAAAVSLRHGKNLLTEDLISEIQALYMSRD